MKKIYLTLISLAILLAVSGCMNPLFDNPGNGSDEQDLQYLIPAGYGAVQVSFVQGAVRTAIPEFVMSAFQRYQYYFAKEDANGEFGDPELKTPTGGLYILEEGTYKLTVKAFLSASADSLAAEGTSVKFDIKIGEINTGVIVTLRPFVTGEGTGTLEFGISYPSGTTVRAYTLSQIAGDDSYDLTGTTTGTNPITRSGTQENIPVGYYILYVLLSNSNNAFTSRTEVVHIYQNYTTRTVLAEYTFVSADFNSYLVINTNNSGSGSLRQALISAPAGSIVNVMLEQGSVIELESVLSLTKSVTIEGNSVILTRSPSWVTVDGSSQLLNINTAGVTATIRRIHFKDGKASHYGAAIMNFGNMIIESCIFSGNQTTTAHDTQGGGAIFNGSIMEIKASTFYNNSSGKRGGAIFTSGAAGSLTLTGNIFYENTASEGSVVYRNNGSVLSSGYNVVDVAIGTDITESGWVNSTGTDISVYRPSILPGNFKLLSESDANIIDTLIENYPIEDFYGNPINTVNGAAAGAVQSVLSHEGYFFDLSIINPSWGSVEILPQQPNEDGFVSGSVTLTAIPAQGFTFRNWQINVIDIETDLSITLPNGHAKVTAIFQPAVDILADAVNSLTTPGTLRFALANANDGDTIKFIGVTAGETIIELSGALPQITRNIIIEGSGITLTRSSSWINADDNSQFLQVSSSGTAVIRRVHFKGGRATNNGSAVHNNGVLTLESCIFSDNQFLNTSGNSSVNGGAIFNNGTLTVNGCTFYNNSTTSRGGAIYNYQGWVTLEGNIFYGNTAIIGDPIIFGSTNNIGFNIVDIPGWGGTNVTIINKPFISFKSFSPLSGSEVVGIITSLPDGYPTVDFYGTPITNGAAAGAIQDIATGNGYVLSLKVNKNDRGSIEATPAPDDEGFVSGLVTLTAVPEGCEFLYWVVNESIETENPLEITMTEHTVVQAVFNTIFIVNNFTDTINSTNVPGTLRYALTHVDNGDIIRFDNVEPGSSVIALASALPPINRNISIEGMGITITPSSSWTSNTDSLLLINTGSTVTINRIHFNNGRASSGGAIRNSGNLILESCIFSDNQNTGTQGAGGAIYNSGTLHINGCTFYENKTINQGRGGVIYNTLTDSILNLKGNLFYGNTANGASNGHVVFINNGIVESIGYNIVDVIDVLDGTSQRGWNSGTGDTTFADLSITGIPFNTTTFAPVSGLGNVIPSAPAGFPVKDFYGNTRTFPNAPGAVAIMP